MEENKDNVNLENTQNVEINTNNVNNQPIENDSTNVVENTQSEVNINDNGNVQPTVTIETNTNTDNNVQIEQKQENDYDYSLKKPDFVIKSKKDTVAEEVERRNKKIQEKIDKANANYKPNSKFKNFLLILFFFILFFFILFLPEIRTFILSKQNKNEEVKIVDGYLDCNLDSTSDKFDLNYSYIFKFKDNKLYYLSVETVTKGDSINDEVELKEKYSKCKNLQDQVEQLDGITVNCSNNGGKVTNTETFNYKSLDKEKITAAFAEAEGNYPEYDLDEDMDKIEKNMNMAGYTCKRKTN